MIINKQVSDMIYGSIWEPTYRDLQRAWTRLNGSERLFDEFSGISHEIAIATDTDGFYLQIGSEEALVRLESALGPNGRAFMRAWYLKKAFEENG